MARNLPPLNPLRVFEAAARHVHFTRAAAELGITQAAVSRQISVLEDWLGVKLFQRRHNELRLTPAGSQYLTMLGQAFDLIEASTPRTGQAIKQSVITLRVYATFAMRWLIPRLQHFTSRHPDILVDIKTSVTPIKFRPEETGLMIDYHKSELEDVVSQHLFGDIIVPVCSPALLRDGSLPKEPREITRYTLLHSRRRAYDWVDWFAHVGIKGTPQDGCIFDNSSLTYQAAKMGIGVAMGQVYLLEPELLSGDLVIPIDHRLERPRGYCLIYPKRVRRDPRVIAFHEWIVEEAAAPTVASLPPQTQVS
jgi:LysR family glycine cleavage system transcriptional activator